LGGADGAGRDGGELAGDHDADGLVVHAPDDHEEVALEEPHGGAVRSRRAEHRATTQLLVDLLASTEGRHHSPHERVEDAFVEHLRAIELEHQHVGQEAAVEQGVHPAGARRLHLRVRGEGVGRGLLGRQRLPVREAVAHEDPRWVDVRQLDAARQGGDRSGVRATVPGRRRDVAPSVAAFGAGATHQRGEEQPGGEPPVPARGPRLVVVGGHGAGQPTRHVLWPTMQEPLEHLLAELKDAIDASGAGADNKDDLARLAGEVERRLSDDDPEGVVEELREEVTRFEASHPNLAAAIGRAADALSAIGL
jgi:hypothetical protein